MQNRIKEARKHFGLTQTEFGERIGIKGNTVTGYEKGLRSPSDAVITSLCREFNLSERWLREGEGPMLRTLTEGETLARFFGQVSFEENSFRKRFLLALSRLDEDQWAVLEQLVKDLNA